MMDIPDNASGSGRTSRSASATTETMGKDMPSETEDFRMQETRPSSIPPQKA